MLATLLGGCAARPGEALTRPTRAIYLSAKSAERLVAQAQALLSQRAPTLLIVTEEDLNSFLQSRISEDDVLRDLRVWFTRGEVFVATDLTLLGARQLDVALVVGADQGDLTLTVQRAALDGRPLSGLVLKALREAAKVALADARLPISVERVTLGEGRMLLWARGKSSLPY